VKVRVVGERRKKRDKVDARILTSGRYQSMYFVVYS
jgi:hypothetical protein